MRLEAWRIVKDRHAAAAFSGEGAYLYGGRWNSPGVRIVYTSGTRALAALETLVHLNPPLSFRYVVFRVEFDEGLVEKVSAAALPGDWSDEPPPPVAQAVGDLWVKQARSAVLELPSVIIRGESNCLLNPAHHDFQRITICPPERFAFDPRLL
jgi:RES domain-containing protein